jgi:hypothetical protein
MNGSSGSRSSGLARRQQQLLLRSQHLRAELGLEVQRLQPPLRLADRVRAGWQWLRANPQWPLGAAAVLVVLRPRRAWRWGLRLWWGWRSWQRLQRWLQAPR